MRREPVHRNGGLYAARRLSGWASTNHFPPMLRLKVLTGRMTEVTPPRFTRRTVKKDGCPRTLNDLVPVARASGGGEQETTHE